MFRRFQLLEIEEWTAGLYISFSGCLACFPCLKRCIRMHGTLNAKSEDAGRLGGLHEECIDFAV